METPVPDSVSAVQNVTNATRDLESEYEAGQEGKVREIIVDNTDAEPKVSLVGQFFTNFFIHGCHIHLDNTDNYLHSTYSRPWCYFSNKNQ